MRLHCNWLNLSPNAGSISDYCLTQEIFHSNSSGILPILRWSLGNFWKISWLPAEMGHFCLFEAKFCKLFAKILRRSFRNWKISWLPVEILGYIRLGWTMFTSIFKRILTTLAAKTRLVKWRFYTSLQTENFRSWRFYTSLQTEKVGF